MAGWRTITVGRREGHLDIHVLVIGQHVHSTTSVIPEWYIKNRQAFFEDIRPRAYPVDVKLALHLIDWLMQHDFDVASSKCMREATFIVG